MKSSWNVRPLALLGIILVGALPARADYMDHFVIRQDVGQNKVPSLGDSHWVLIPVEVAGFPPFDDAALEHFYSLTDVTGFASYYRVASLGRFRPNVTVLPKVQYSACPLSEVDFPGCEVPRGDAKALAVASDLLRDILRKADEAGADFSQFDINGRKGSADGYVDGVMVLSNTPFSGIAFPVAFFNDGDNLAGGTSGPFVVDGVKVSHVAIGGHSDNEVMVHEAGHLLGLTDLYDESGKYSGLPLSVMGAWSYGPRIPLPDAETRYRLRWSNLLQVTGSAWVRLLPVESGGQVLRVGSGDQYFLMENRGPGAFDTQLAARGLAVFHVDRTGLQGEEGTFLDRLLSCVNCNPWHPYIRLVEADLQADISQGGDYSSYTDLFRTGDSLLASSSDKAFSEENPHQSLRWYDGTFSGYEIRNVVVHKDASITFALVGPEAEACVDPLCDEGEACLPTNCDPSGSSCATVLGDASGAWPWVLALMFFFRNKASAADTSSSFFPAWFTPPSLIWKNSQKLASSLSAGTSAKGSLHCLATCGSKCRQFTQA